MKLVLIITIILDNLAQGVRCNIKNQLCYKQNHQKHTHAMGVRLTSSERRSTQESREQRIYISYRHCRLCTTIQFADFKPKAIKPKSTPIFYWIYPIMYSNWVVNSDLATLVFGHIGGEPSSAIFKVSTGLYLKSNPLATKSKSKNPNFLNHCGELVVVFE